MPEGSDKVVPVSFDFKVLDAALIVHLLQTNGITTFDDYATDVFIPYINRQLDTAERVDVVWDFLTSHAALRSQPGRKEAKKCDERWQERTSFQVTGLISSVMLQTSKNSSIFSPIRLS